MENTKENMHIDTGALRFIIATHWGGKRIGCVKWRLFEGGHYTINSHSAGDCESMVVLIRVCTLFQKQFSRLLSGLFQDSDRFFQVSLMHNN